jgi:predicted amidohydrolase YtcJ
MRAERWALAGERALVVEGDRIAWVGPREALPRVDRVVELGPGQLVVPGFDDSHQHLLGYAELQSQVPLWDVTSIPQLLERIAAAADPREPGEWIVAAGHDELRLDERRHPTRAELDTVAPRNPVLVRRACSHLSIASTLAGGEGDGVLREAEQRRVKDRIPRPALDLPAAAAAYHRRGITSIGEASAGNRRVEDVALYRGLRLRVNLMCRGLLAEKVLAEGPPSGDGGEGDEWVRYGPIKLMVDGTIGNGTACVSGRDVEPLLPRDELDAVVAEAHAKGLQVAIHAVGDEAVAMCLDAIERAGGAGARHRIEHVEAVRPGLPERMARLGVVGAIQTVFDDDELHLLPPGVEGFPWATLHRAGVRIANGSDNPVVPEWSPLLGIRRAVAAGLDETTALASYTSGGAWATFEEERKGTLEPGKLADLAVLSGPLLDEATAVDLTVVDGEVVFER